MSARFELFRDRDVSGVSGTGRVAEGVVFGDGTAVLRWVTEHRSTAVYDSMAVLEAVHGHDGATRVEWLDDPSRDMRLRFRDVRLSSRRPRSDTTSG